ncbi:peptide-methionine (S)-S-oxide reductase MsrA [Candidatus Berkelbacteria bacterium]|nr:peptide-methionine (S)-S-oxide reductase MsrA [Candidatus Berkelbacteria bacterium]
MAELATFGGGCFWGTEAAFKKVPGVVETKVGYMGGAMEQPNYDDVLIDQTGHVEVVEVKFDSAKVSYGQLLELFWLIHDPTQGNRQGNDVGSQYRSVIFTHSDEQRAMAEASKQALEQSKKYDRPITTTIEPAGRFWRAEEYHQNYLDTNPGGYCHVNLGQVDQFITDQVKQ